MRKLVSVAVAWGAAFAVAASAEAATRPFTGVLSLVLGGLPPITATGSGVALVNGSGGGLHLSSFTLAPGVFQTQKTVLVTDPAVVSTIPSLRATLTNLSGSFLGLSGATPAGGGAMALAGVANVCLFTPGCLPGLVLTVPLTAGGGATGVGVGGTIVATGAVNVTLAGLAPWTVATATVMNINTTAPTQTFALTGFAHGPASEVTSTVVTSGVISLVTPIDIRTSLAGSLPQIPSFGVLTLHFVPEPGTLLLLGSAIAGLMALGRRRIGG